MQTKQAKNLRITSSREMNSLFLWNFKAAFSGKGIEFQDFREYSPGDDAKYIDWVISSREGRTIMRRYREEKQGTILCYLDIRKSLYFWWNSLKKNLVKDIVSLLAHASFWSGEAFWGYIVWENKWRYIEAKKSKISLYKMLHIEDIVPRSLEKKLSLEALLKNPLKRSIVFVISDNFDIDEKSFKMAALRHDLVYIHISSHFENTLDGSWVWIFRWKKQLLWIDLDKEEIKNEYRKKRQEKMKNFSKKMRKMRIDTLFLDEKKSLFAEFLKLMKQRNK